MSRRGLILAALAMFLCGSRAAEGRAQDDATAALARAFVSEETAAAETALALYAAIAADETATAGIRARALLGLARCHAKVKDAGPAAAALDRLDALAPEAAIAEESRALRASLGAGTGEQEADPAELRKRIIELAAKNAQQDLVDLGRPAIPVLVEMAESGNQVAMAVLAAMRLPEIPDVLVGMLQRKKLEDRVPLVESLANSRGPNPPSEVRADFAPVVTVALQDPSPEVRCAAARLLAGLPALGWDTWKLALSDAQPKVRHAAFDCLSVPNGLSRDALIEAWSMASLDANPGLRQSVASRLAVLKNVSIEAADATAERLARDAEPGVRRNVIQFAQQFAPARAREFVMRGFADPDPEVRRTALRSLRASASDVDALKGLLSDADTQVRVSAAQHLQRVSVPAVICASPADEKKMVALLDDPDHSVRQFAVAVLAHVGSLDVAPRIVPFVDAGSSPEAAAAVHYIIRHDLATAFPRILPVLGVLTSQFGGPWQNLVRLPRKLRINSFDASGVIEWLAAAENEEGALATLAVADTLQPHLMQRLAYAITASTKPANRDRVAAELEKVKDPERAAGLIDGLHSVFEGSKAAERFLGRALGSNEPRLRRAAAFALAACAKSEAVPALIEALAVEKDEGAADEMRRLIAERAGADHIEILRRAIAGGDTAAKQSLVRAIGRIPGAEAGRALLELAREIDLAETSDVYYWIATNRVEGGLALITAALESDRFENAWSARRSAIQAIGIYGDPASADLLLRCLARWPKDATNDGGFSYREFGRENDSQLRIRMHPALLALFRLNEAAFPGRVDAIIAGDLADDIKKDAVLMLAFLPHAGALQSVESALVHRSPAVRAAAAQAAGLGLMTELAPAIRSLVRSSEEEVRKQAENALLRFARFGLTVR